MTTDYHTYRAIITVTAQQVPGTFLTVPHSHNGIAIELRREPSTMKPTGCIALAGEFWKQQVAIYDTTLRDYAKPEEVVIVSTPDPFGSGWRIWTQPQLDYWVQSRLEEIRHERKNRDKERALAAQHQAYIANWQAHFKALRDTLKPPLNLATD